MSSVFRHKKVKTFTARIKLPTPDRGLAWGQLPTSCTEKKSAEKVAAILSEVGELLVAGVEVGVDGLAERLTIASGFPASSKLSPEKAKRLAERLVGRVSATKQRPPLREILRQWQAAKSPGESRLMNVRRAVDRFEAWAGARAAQAADTFRPSDLQAWYAHECETSGKSVSTVNGWLECLGTLYNFGVRMEISSRNPCPAVIKRKHKPKSRDNFTPEDLKKLDEYFHGLAAIRDVGFHGDRGEDWRLLFLMGLCLGARIGDAVRMNRENLRMVGGKLCVCWVPEKTKSSSGREQVVVAARPLAELLQDKMHLAPDESLVPSLVDFMEKSNLNISTLFIEHVQKAGVEVVFEKHPSGRRWSRKSFHSLRGTLNSAVIASGTSQVVAQKILGHSSAEINAEHYLKLETATQEKAIAGGLSALGFS